MEQNNIKSIDDQRKFTKIFNDFLESELLDKHEKLIFIAIKRFADNETLVAFPSLKTLHKMTGISIKWIQKSINHMEELGILRVEQRISEENGIQSNLYTLYDYAEVWKTGKNEEIKEIIHRTEIQHMIDILKSFGYSVNKEKGLESEPTKAQNQAIQHLKNQTDMPDITTNLDESQHLERYTLEDIKQLFDYDIMIHDTPFLQQDIDSVMDILHTAMNSNKTTIRIAREDKPAMVVIGKLMKLGKESIVYAIGKFKEQTGRIKNPASYMLTILYNAPEQYRLDIQNRAIHDMAHCMDGNDLLDGLTMSGEIF